MLRLGTVLKSCQKYKVSYWKTASVLLFLPSLYFVGFYASKGGGPDGSGSVHAFSGFEILVTGWMAVFTGGCFAWFANAFWVYALFTKSPVRRRIASIGAILLGCSLFLAFSSIENMKLGAGFYLWLASFLLLIVMPARGDV